MERGEHSRAPLAPQPHPLCHHVHRPRRLVQQGASGESGGAALTVAASGAAAASAAASEEAGVAVASGEGTPRERWTPGETCLLKLPLRDCWNCSKPQRVTKKMETSQIRDHVTSSLTNENGLE